MIRRFPERVQAIVVFSQAHRMESQAGTARVDVQLWRRLTRRSLRFSGDPSRVYLRTLAGGNGSWYLASRYPDRFAALVVVCGLIRSSAVGLAASSIQHLRRRRNQTHSLRWRSAWLTLRIWIVHGDADPSVSVEDRAGCLQL